MMGFARLSGNNGGRIYVKRLWSVNSGRLENDGRLSFSFISMHFRAFAHHLAGCFAFSAHLENRWRVDFPGEVP